MYRYKEHVRGNARLYLSNGTTAAVDPSVWDRETLLCGAFGSPGDVLSPDDYIPSTCRDEVVAANTDK